MKGVKILLVMLLVGSIASGVYARPVEVYLMPSSSGEPSKMVPVGDKDWAWWLIQYDEGTSNYYLSGLIPGDTLGVFFEPPAACSLVEVHFCKYRFGFDGPTQYYGIVADIPDGVTIGDFGEYHSAASMPGPSCIGTILAGPTAMDITAFEDWEWDTLTVPGQPDIGTDAFWAGWTLEDTTHSTRIDAGDATTPLPLHAVGYKQGGTGPETNGPGWYSSWHLYWVRALVKVYENLPPNTVSFDRLTDTYTTGSREVTAIVEDVLGIPLNLMGVAWAKLWYSVNGGDDVSIDMDLIEGDSLYGTYSAEIPGAGVGDEIAFYIEAADLQDAKSTSPSASYVIRTGHNEHILLVIGPDDYYAPPYSWDPVRAIYDFVDVWDCYFYGYPDASVFDYYTPGKGDGDKVILWFTWGDIGPDLNLFKDFMDAGGKLLLSGEDIGWGAGLAPDWGAWEATPEDTVPYEYFGWRSGFDDDTLIGGHTTVNMYGTDAVITAGLEYTQVTPYYWAGPGAYSYIGKFDELAPTAVTAFTEETYGFTLGYRYEKNGAKLVCTYFPIQYIGTPETQVVVGEDTIYADTLLQNTLMRNIFSYLEVGVEESTEPVVYRLPVVSPNPLSRPTTISFSIPRTEYVSMKVYDVTGSLVSTLVNKRLTAGTHSLTVDTKKLASGVYFLRMDAEGFSGTRKFVVMK